MDFIPSSIVLSVVDAKLRLEIGVEKMLSKVLEPLRDRYDVILIKTAPMLGALNINTLPAAYEVIINNGKSANAGDDGPAGFINDSEEN